MKCVCKFSRNSDVPVEIRANSNPESTQFDVVVGQTYDIYGQCVFSQRVRYLIDPERNSKPNWNPAELFEIADGSVSSEWEFQFFPEGFKDDLGAIWGYPELVRDAQHFNDLAERESHALLIFAQRKREIELR